MEKVADILFALLRFEICGTELCDDVKNSIDEEDLPRLFKISKRHDLAHLIADALDKNGLFFQNAEAKKRFLQERTLAIFRYEQRRYEYTQICETFEKERIPFIPLKGAIIQDLYPEPWMRTSCDIDILVKEDDLNVAVAVLKKNLEYNCDFIGGHDAQIFAPNGVHLELHYRLLEDDASPQQQTFFESIWSNATNNSRFQRCMTNEHFYEYFLLHTAKHVKAGGCGVRPFLDIWLLRKKMIFDNQALKKILKETGLETFAKAVESLANVWFSGAKATKLDEELAQYVLTGGVYGTMENRVAVQTNRKKGKIRYTLSRIFLPYNELKYKYPTLKKHPILFPFYQVRRWFNLLNKDRRKASVREWNEIVNGDKEKTERVANLLKDLGI